MFASSSSSFVHLLLLWLLAIIEGGGFTCSLTVRLLRVAKQSGAHIFCYNAGTHRKAGNGFKFHPILGNENMPPNSGCSCRTRCCIGDLRTETAAAHRMATAITQQTLCQVSTNTSKLLQKTCHKLWGIPEVPSQRITDFDNATRQLHQLSCILDSCTILSSYEVSEVQKALLLLLRIEKGSTQFDELQEYLRMSRRC